MASDDVRSEASKPPFVIPDIPIAGPEATGDNFPEQMAPLIFSAWYVIAKSEDAGRTLSPIRVLAQPLVFYRTEAGKPVVLDDRCAHRRFPLSKGRLKGDRIECGYHGYTYEKSGQCIWAPGTPVEQELKKGLPFGVRSYPCAERGGWLWVWMGDPTRADPCEIPLPDIGGNCAVKLYGYKLNPANYMLLIENLLDLTHVHFLHGASDLTYAAGSLPREAPSPVNGVSWMKEIPQTETGLLGSMCGDDPERLVRMAEDSTQYGPSLNIGRQSRSPLPGDIEKCKLEKFVVAHALTPLDHRNTHQFFMLCYSDPLVIDPQLVLKQTENVVFEQDAEAVLFMQRFIDEDNRPGRVEFNMACDRFGMAMRKILRVMKERELAELESVGRAVRRAQP
ncbi:MAG: aromatic ring-hydroxylating dioxygenase subunit alpha [Parvularculaceae bacterium]